jgi:predicted RNA binding protein YcfA (HicA-like mRNA interferase family)
MQVLNQKKAIKLLEENGWIKEAGGKHSVKMCKTKCRPITLPRHKGQDYGPGLAASILKAAGL